jgi:hypothetical protein
MGSGAVLVQESEPEQRVTRNSGDEAPSAAMGPMSESRKSGRMPPKELPPKHQLPSGP